MWGQPLAQAPTSSTSGGGGSDTNENRISKERIGQNLALGPSYVIMKTDIYTKALLNAM